MRTGFDILAPIYDLLVPAPDVRLLAQDAGAERDLRLLDLGGGTGRIAAALRDHVRSVIVCDLSSAMLHRARRRNVLCVQAAAEHLPFADGAFDRVLIHDALHHFRDPEQVIREVYRVLSNGGAALFEEPDIETRSGRFVAAAERLTGFRSRFLPSSVLVQQLKKVGFACRIVRRIGFRTRIRATRPPA